MIDNPQTLCRTCVTPIGFIDCPTGGWWAHEQHPADEHDAVPGAWVDGDELMEAIAAEVWEQCRTESISLVVDDPRNIAGTAAAVARRLQPAEMEQLRRERDLAVAHDRQPYPTAWAYEQACKALRRKTEAIERVLEWADGLDIYAQTVLKDDSATNPSAAHVRRLLDTQAGEAQQQCSGVETAPNRCTCPCEGCKHHCGAHNADEAQQPPCAECGHPHGVHRVGDDPVTPGTCAGCGDDDRHDYVAGAQQQGETETGEPSPTEALLVTRCDACRHALIRHHQHGACTVVLCVCGTFRYPVEELPQ